MTPPMFYTPLLERESEDTFFMVLNRCTECDNITAYAAHHVAVVIHAKLNLGSAYVLD